MQNVHFFQDEKMSSHCNPQSQITEQILLGNAGI